MKRDILYITIICVLISFLYLMYLNILHYKHDVLSLTSYLEKCDKFTKEQEKTIKELNKSYSEMLKEYEKLYNYTEQNLKELMQEKEEVKDAIEWFKQNSKINSSFYPLPLHKCIKKHKELCEINLACISWINHDEYGFTYREEEKDFLESLYSFYKNKAGDCEDFALYYKGELNYLKEYALSDLKCDDIIYFAYSLYPFPQTSFTSHFYLDNKEEWYYENVYSLMFSNISSYAIICGIIPQFSDSTSSQTTISQNEKENVGHCVVVLSPKHISSSKDIIDAYMIEPQNGEYLGKVKKDDLYNETLEKGIYYIITDNDFFLYSYASHHFISFSEYLNRIKETINTYYKIIK